MKKIVLFLCAAALVGVGAVVVIKKISAAPAEKSGIEKKAVVLPSVILPLVVEKRSDKLPKKVSGKDRRKISKEMKKHSLSAKARALAFVKAEGGKKTGK